MKLFQCFHIQMVIVPFLRNPGNNLSAVMFFQRFIFSTKKFLENYSERIWIFHCKYSIRKKPRVIVVALPSCMMLFDLETKLLRYSRRDFLEKIDVRTEIRTWAIREVS